jgi:hypothetical protein
MSPHCSIEKRQVWNEFLEMICFSSDFSRLSSDFSCFSSEILIFLSDHFDFLSLSGHDWFCLLENQLSATVISHFSSVFSRFSLGFSSFPDFPLVLSRFFSGFPRFSSRFSLVSSDLEDEKETSFDFQGISGRIFSEILSEGHCFHRKIHCSDFWSDAQFLTPPKISTWLPSWGRVQVENFGSQRRDLGIARSVPSFAEGWKLCHVFFDFSF